MEKAWEWWRKPGNGGRELRNGGSVGMGVAWEWWRKPGNGGRELRNGGSVGMVEKAWEWGEGA